MSEKKILSENDILDYIFQTLYYNLDRNELHFEKDILEPSGLVLTSKQIEHLRELMMNSGLVNQSIGFGKLGNVYLNGKGIQVMKKYKTYQAYLQLEDPFTSLSKMMPPTASSENLPSASQPLLKDEEEDTQLGDDDMAN